jgi:DNA processing protein
MPMNHVGGKMEKIYLAALQMVSGIGNARLRGLVSFFGSAQQAWLADKRDFISMRMFR